MCQELDNKYSKAQAELDAEQKGRAEQERIGREEGGGGGQARRA